jgi:flagellar biosynthetic protein FliR
MPEILRQLLDPDRWPVFVLITARLGGLMLTAPLWSMTTMPRSVRAAITVVLAGVLLPLAPTVALPEQMIELPLPVALEIVVGLVIGLTATVLVQGAALAGEVVSLQMGLSMGGALAPLPDLPIEGVAQLYSHLAVLIYVSLGGHLVLLQGLAESLRALPPGAPLGLVQGGSAMAGLVGALFGSALGVAAPVMVTLLMVNAALSVLSRAVPQLNAMMVSLPLTIGVGLVTLGLALPLVGGAIAGWMTGLPSDVARALGAFTPGP